MNAALLALALASLAQAAGASPAPDGQARLPSVSRAQACTPGCLSTTEAVTYASYLGSKAGVAGIFEMPVRAVGAQSGHIYLNSERDYRDRNCLTVSIPMRTARRMFGSDDPDEIAKHLKGQRIFVKGIARQVRINFTANGQPTEKYYFQIHVLADQPEQLRLAV
ncbi:hypothetical protein [Novosphingobium mangrovi (ex Hu et al. 2023)]|uniref:Uncharacterized protein n=1 Tax=Novosphingobium mangrovi (ex Hu et al. 2023) TaxID=2930094 RepID=A0ABT0A8J9_9SPHN|nr:hypothetical protein [Novosphingobium mangrovi (ex Hu et al. 2023)]MCJ1959510.1 hypothetical protein [Novosphingobium mangrovi (ex Hu et al. 2023)]